MKIPYSVLQLANDWYIQDSEGCTCVSVGSKKGKETAERQLGALIRAFVDGYKAGSKKKKITLTFNKKGDRVLVGRK